MKDSVAEAQERDKGPARLNTVSMLGQAYSLLGFRIVDGVVGAGIPIKPRYSAVFAQLGPQGARSSALARGANMTPQAMGELVDELEAQGYVVRAPDPADRRAKLVTMTELGVRAVEAAQLTITDIESSLDAALGSAGHDQLRVLLQRILASEATPPSR
ncbi:MAG: MarR family transcriptional regulator [Actinobacteria bacterium]|nr:MarR family transcriptional regulator [Actinomycetota bacterium]